MKTFKLDYDFLRASIRAASGPIGIPIQVKEFFIRTFITRTFIFFARKMVFGSKNYFLSEFSVQINFFSQVLIFLFSASHN